jgi:hypothetical protein
MLGHSVVTTLVCVSQELHNTPPPFYSHEFYLLPHRRRLDYSTFRDVQATIIAAAKELAASFDFGAIGACRRYE